MVKWITAKGEHLEPQEMSEEHIKSIIKLLTNTNAWDGHYAGLSRYEWIKVLEDELRSREFEALVRECNEYIALYQEKLRELGLDRPTMVYKLAVSLERFISENDRAGALALFLNCVKERQNAIKALEFIDRLFKNGADVAPLLNSYIKEKDLTVVKSPASL